MSKPNFPRRFLDRRYELEIRIKKNIVFMYYIHFYGINRFNILLCLFTIMIHVFYAYDNLLIKTILNGEITSRLNFQFSYIPTFCRHFGSMIKATSITMVCQGRENHDFIVRN